MTSKLTWSRFAFAACWDLHFGSRESVSGCPLPGCRARLNARVGRGALSAGQAWIIGREKRLMGLASFVKRQNRNEKGHRFSVLIEAAIFRLFLILCMN